MYDTDGSKVQEQAKPSRLLEEQMKIIYELEDLTNILREKVSIIMVERNQIKNGPPDMTAAPEPPGSPLNAHIENNTAVLHLVRKKLREIIEAVDI